ncbi:MAG: DUF169 domain-containing protein [Chloroflexi bacterium]|nr:DUF169 domain-containing protein [Chloroflexota bacterium]
MSNASVASSLQDRLQLSIAPVAVAFVQEQPPGVPRTQKLAPSACGFWRQAEKEVFYAAAEDHHNCPVGTYVMGFPMSEQMMEALMGEIGYMCTSAYVEEAEVPQVPKVQESRAGIVYGPLRDFPLEPDAVLLWVNPQQAMLLTESCGGINWTRPPQSIFGRPGCAAIPVAMQGDQPALSFGCVGMRINTDIGGEYFLMALSRQQLASLESALFVTNEVHYKMRSYYLDRAAKAPSVRT